MMAPSLPALMGTATTSASACAMSSLTTVSEGIGMLGTISPGLVLGAAQLAGAMAALCGHRLRVACYARGRLTAPVRRPRRDAGPGPSGPADRLGGLVGTSAGDVLQGIAERARLVARHLHDEPPATLERNSHDDAAPLLGDLKRSVAGPRLHGRHARSPSGGCRDHPTLRSARIHYPDSGYSKETISNREFWGSTCTSTLGSDGRYGVPRAV